VWIYTADEAARGYPTGHWKNAALLLVVAVGSLLLLAYYRRLNVAIARDTTGKQRLYRL
jgi:hypothetical protein